MTIEKYHYYVFFHNNYQDIALSTLTNAMVLFSIAHFYRVSLFVH